jgi:hypothetical protein
LVVVFPIFEVVAKGVAEREDLEKGLLQEEAILVVLLFHGVIMR